jgi:hypothetical protein
MSTSLIFSNATVTVALTLILFANARPGFASDPFSPRSATGCTNQLIRSYLTLSIQYRFQTDLFLACEQPFQRFIKFSTERE